MRVYSVPWSKQGGEEAYYASECGQRQIEDAAAKRKPAKVLVEKIEDGSLFRLIYDADGEGDFLV